MVKLMHALTIDNTLVSVKDNNIESGLKCKCFCPACGEPLVAKKGKIKNWHFAHYSKVECEYASETAIHYIAKDIIKEKGLCLPILTIMEYLNRNSLELDHAKRLHLFTEYTNLSSQFKIDFCPLVLPEIKEKQHIKLDNVASEKKLDRIIPDITGTFKDDILCVEIAYSHFVDENKLVYLKNNEINCIEIDLSELKKGCTVEDIEGIILSGNQSRWIYNKDTYHFTERADFILSLQELRKKSYQEEAKAYLNSPDKINLFPPSPYYLEKGEKVYYRKSPERILTVIELITATKYRVEIDGETYEFDIDELVLI